MADNTSGYFRGHIIQRINKAFFFLPKREGQMLYEGYQVETDGGIVFVGITPQQECCERAGITCEDNLEPFVGAKLLDVVVIDGNYDKESVIREDYVADAVFVEFVTDKGSFQVTLYNEHNGYYGHEVRVIYVSLENFSVMLLEKVI